MYVTKKNEAQYIPNEATLKLATGTNALIEAYLKIANLTAKEKDELTPRIRKQNSRL